MRLPRPGRRRSLPFLGLALGAVMASTALSACGDDATAETSDAGSDPAASDSDSGDDGAASGGPELPDDEVILDFYQCLRDNGLDVEDPDLSGGGTTRGGPGGGAVDPDDPEHMAILEDCQEETGLGGPGGVQGGSFGDNLADPEALIEFTTCMREHGIDMPDPDADGALHMPPDLDRNDPELQDAFEACSDHLSGGGVGITQ